MGDEQRVVVRPPRYTRMESIDDWTNAMRSGHDTCRPIDRRRPRVPHLAVALALMVGACGGADAASSDNASATVGPDRTTEVSAGPSQPQPPPWPWDRAAAGEDVPASVPLEQIRSGGPPPDGIPPIDEPVFESVADAGAWLTDRDPVMVVDVDGDVRAYPLAILTYHEIVNDTVGGEPLVVTYCPLCNSGLAFERTVEGTVLDFGTSGRLYQSNLVMYDRATRSLWSQFSGEAIVGDQLGTKLTRVPVQIAAFSDFARSRPDATVLSRDTGADRPYGTNPYTNYDSGETPFLFDGETSDTLPQMQRIVTAGGRDDPVAYPLDVLRRDRVITDTVDGAAVVVLWSPGTASALDTERIAEGADVGASGVFRPVADGQTLTFAAAGDEQFRDRETDSTWTVLGEAIAGPLTGTRLEPVAHDDTFWFVQYAFRPETRVFTGA